MIPGFGNTVRDTGNAPTPPSRWFLAVSWSTLALGIVLAGALALRLYRLGTAIAIRVMRLFSRGGLVKGMPGLGAWTAYREFPAPAKRTFMEMYKDQEKGQ